MQGYNVEGHIVFTQKYTLEDTPNLQVIVFPEMANIVKLTIESVYKGSTYQDTALSGLFVDGVLLERYRK